MDCVIHRKKVFTISPSDLRDFILFRCFYKKDFYSNNCTNKLVFVYTKTLIKT